VPVDRSEEIQTIRSQLPIITEEQIIMEAIHDNLVVLICGETGKCEMQREISSKILLN
jgi:ATP-dependent RNA helicase DHX37/DHR1